jgi:hypothetical protein
MHLLRDASSVGSREIAPRNDSRLAGGPEDEVTQARLDLRLKRPVVTLGVLDDSGSGPRRTDEGWLLPERALPFLLTGASAVVGPWWATSRQADEVFWNRFYELLQARLPLGEAVRQGRLAVAQAQPHGWDWLAYGLYGDPRARAYWPQESEGYAVLECLNGNEPLQVGQRYVFRASIRSKPPLDYQERLVHTRELPREAQALFLAPGLLQDGELLNMVQAGRTMLEAQLALTPTAPGRFPLQVQLFEGEEHVKSLRLTLRVTEPVAGGRASE